MSIHAIVEQPPESDDKRDAVRWRIRLELPDGLDPEGAHVVIHDISTAGMLIETRSKLEVGQSVALSLPESLSETDKVVARVVWQNEPLFGCRFDQPLPQAAVSAARLRGPTRDMAQPPHQPIDAPTSETTPEATAEALPDRLRRLRLERGLSRAALSEQTGFSKPTIWGWETGRTTPRADNLRMLAGIFGLTEQQLLFGGQKAAAPETPAPNSESHARSLHMLVDQAKHRIAQAAGVPKSSVHIHIEF